jgi:hypothetical protein
MNEFSKGTENLGAGLWPYLCRYNFGRIHGSRTTTPCEDASATDRVRRLDVMLNFRIQ